MCSWGRKSGCSRCLPARIPGQPNCHVQRPAGSRPPGDTAGVDERGGNDTQGVPGSLGGGIPHNHHTTPRRLQATAGPAPLKLLLARAKSSPRKSGASWGRAGASEKQQRRSLAAGLSGGGDPAMLLLPLQWPARCLRAAHEQCGMQWHPWHGAVCQQCPAWQLFCLCHMEGALRGALLLPRTPPACLPQWQ